MLFALPVNTTSRHPSHQTFVRTPTLFALDGDDDVSRCLKLCLVLRRSIAGDGTLCTYFSGTISDDILGEIWCRCSATFHLCKCSKSSVFHFQRFSTCLQSVHIIYRNASEVAPDIFARTRFVADKTTKDK